MEELEAEIIDAQTLLRNLERSLEVAEKAMKQIKREINEQEAIIHSFRRKMVDYSIENGEIEFFFREYMSEDSMLSLKIRLQGFHFVQVDFQDYSIDILASQIDSKKDTWDVLFIFNSAEDLEFCLNRYNKQLTTNVKI